MWIFWFILAGVFATLGDNEFFIKLFAITGAVDAVVWASITVYWPRGKENLMKIQSNVLFNNIKEWGKASKKQKE